MVELGTGLPFSGGVPRFWTWAGEASPLFQVARGGSVSDQTAGRGIRDGGICLDGVYQVEREIRSQPRYWLSESVEPRNLLKMPRGQRAEGGMGGHRCRRGTRGGGSLPVVAGRLGGLYRRVGLGARPSSVVFNSVPRAPCWKRAAIFAYQSVCPGLFAPVWGAPFPNQVVCEVIACSQRTKREILLPIQASEPARACLERTSGATTEVPVASRWQFYQWA